MMMSAHFVCYIFISNVNIVRFLLKNTEVLTIICDILVVVRMTS